MLVKYKTIITLCIIYVFVVVPSFYIPLHSDDYYYYFLGNSPKEIYDHYLIWSGRLIPNFISSTMLYNLNHQWMAIINSLCFISLCFFISYIPKAATKQKHRFFWLVLFLIFIAYWVSNPNLGQTSFWIVGSANYLWTNMLISLYFVTLFSSMHRDRNLDLILCFIFGLMAGCSNENTSIVVVMITIFMLFIERRKRNVLAALAGTVIGCAVLLLAPGNRNRATLFEQWNNSPIDYKFFIHFFERLPDAMGGYWIVYLCIIISFFCIALKGPIGVRTTAYSLCFFVASIVANSVFIISPEFPPRSKNGSLCFLLISLSFLFNEILNNKDKKDNYFITAMFVGLLIYFAPSYYWFVNSMHSIWGQDKVRMSLISNAKLSGQESVGIPGFYFTTLAKEGDRLDTYQNDRMFDYFGMKNIETFNLGFDYSQILDKNWHVTDINIKSNLNINGIKKYKMVDKFRTIDEVLIRFNISPEVLPNMYSLHFSIKNDLGESQSFDAAGNVVHIGSSFYINQGCTIKKPSQLEYRLINNISGKIESSGIISL
ncbi:DUF6056 family protein [Citrobacter freundii]|uniref:DUF3329 domain-containing protein n=1 Tax=Citrobacter freundii TaxID=546 RepID=UPI0036724A9A